MPIPSCCPRCGVPAPESAPPTTDALLCSACAQVAGGDASAPWWVAAVPSTPPTPSTPPPLPPPRDETVAARPCATRFRRWGAVAAMILLLSGGLLLVPTLRVGTHVGDAPRRVSTHAETERGESPTVPEQPSTPDEEGRSAVTLKPVPRLFDRPASAAKRSSDRASDALAISTPPPLPSPSAAVKSDASTEAEPSHGLHRLDRALEEDLRRQAATAPEIGLGSSGSAILNAYLAHVPANEIALGTANLTDATPLMEVRPDLRMLPIRFDNTCKLNGNLTTHLDVLSRKLRTYLDQFNPEGLSGHSGSPEKLRKTLLTEMRGKKPEWLHAGAVKPLLQILMGEETPFRKVLVEVLTKIDDPAATVALAQRAVFDLSPEVREAAVAALKNRPAADYRPVLLKALRYPWAVPAQHAAEALVTLKDAGAVPGLVSLLKLPDPAGPLTIHKNRHILQDVVRLNHLNNCMMCHPPAAKSNEPVLGVDPVVPLPARLQTPTMMAASQQVMGGHGHGSAAATRTVTTPVVGTTTTTVLLPLLIRGDITFLRQDFTVRQPVGAVRPPQDANAVPLQRFDYVVRTRILSRKQFELLEKAVADRSSYPQRDAVLFALRELTGQDAGPTTEAWVQLFPNAETDVEAARLSHKLLQLDGAEREVMLAKCRDGKGLVYTQALACAISSLKGVAKEHVRGVLTERLTRMSAKTLRDKLQDEDPEIRRAAVLAYGRKDKEQAVPELISALDNPEPVTVRLVEEELTTLTGENLKYPAAWKEWWQKHGEGGSAK